MKTCQINDIYCSNNAKARCKGLCNKHYSRFRAHGNPTFTNRNTRPHQPAAGYNWCALCSLFKPINEFSKSRKNPNGLTTKCKKCTALRWQQYYDPEKDWGRRIKRVYGVTPEDYYTMLRSQDNCCAICKISCVMESSGKLSIDHCHKTGRVRGLLCFRCNATLGKVEESTDILKNLILYLEKTNA